MLYWFSLNFMQINQSQFQFIIFLNKKMGEYSMKLARDVTTRLRLYHSLQYISWPL